MFGKEKPKGNPRQLYGLWLFLGLGIGIAGVIAIVLSLFEIRRSMVFNESFSSIHDDYISYSAFSPDEQRIFSQDSSAQFRFTEISGSRLSQFRELAISFENIQWNSAKTHFLTTDYEQHARLFDKEGNPVTAYEHPGVYFAYWSPLNNRIVTMNNGESRIWTIDGQLVNVVEHIYGYTDSFQWSPDGSRFLHWSSTSEGSIRDMDGNLIENFAMMGFSGAFTWNSSSTAYAIAQYHPETAAEQTLSVFDREGQLLWDEEMTIETIYLLWNADGTRLAVLNAYQAIASIWTVEGEKLVEFPYGTIFLWHPDGETLLAGTNEAQFLQIMDKDGNLVQTLAHDGDTIYVAPQWSPDGEMLATWTNRMEAGYASLMLWDRAGNLLHELKSSTPIQYLVWSPDSSKILSVGGYVARLWSVAEGGEINSLQHLELIYNAQWSADSSRILTMGSTNPMLVENAVWTGEGEHLATLYSGDNFMSYVSDWNADFSQAIVHSGNLLRVMKLEASPIFLDFRFDNP